MISNPLLRLCFIFLTSTLTWLPSTASAERRKEPLPEAPPAPLPFNAQVNRGDSIELQLRIYGRKNQPLKYLIKSPPKFGKLTPPKPLSDEISSVTYTPPTDLAISQDRFFYSVQNAVGVSAPVEVSITIGDLPPKLHFPELLDFSTAILGSTTSKILTLTNRGGGIAKGRLSTAPPWTIKDSPDYQLEAGRSATFSILFTPTEVGTADGFLRFTSHPDLTLPLHATTTASISVNPEKILLSTSKLNPIRTGELVITNQTDSPREVLLSSTDRLLLPPKVLVPPSQTLRIPIQTHPTDLATLETTIIAKSDALSLTIPITAPPVGPILQSLPQTLSFTATATPHTAAAQLILKNVGGSPAQVSLTIAPPFTTPQTSITLLPGEEKPLQILILPTSPAKYRQPLLVSTDSQTLEVTLIAEILPEPLLPNQPPSSTPTPSDSPTPTQDPEFFEKFPSTLLLETNVRITDIHSTHATIQWPATLRQSTEFRIDQLALAPPKNDRPLLHWIPLPHTKITQKSDQFIAELSNLTPNSLYRIRIVPLNSPTGTTPPIFTPYLKTLPTRNFWPTITPLRTLLFLCAAVIAFLIREKWLNRRHP